MQADVRRLRVAGRRLARERIAELAATRGELVVFKRPDQWRSSLVPVAALMGPDRITYLLPPLDQVRIARWRGNQLVLVGLEEQDLRQHKGYALQSWWVQLVADLPEALSDPVPPRTDPVGSGG